MKAVSGVLALIARGVFAALNIWGITKSARPKEEKESLVQAKLESFRKAALDAASKTEPTWDDAILEGAADWLDEAAEAIVNKWS